MPRIDGIEATRRLTAASPATKVVILTTYDLDEYVFDALGASGFILKDAPADQLVNAVRVAAAGDALLAPSITRRLVEEFARRAPRADVPLGDLTARELEVLKLMAPALSNAEIANRLVVSEGTVKTHVARILMKLECRDRVQAVVAAYESGLVQPGIADRTGGSSIRALSARRWSAVAPIHAVREARTAAGIVSVAVGPTSSDARRSGESNRRVWAAIPAAAPTATASVRRAERGDGQRREGDAEEDRRRSARRGSLTRGSRRRPTLGQEQDQEDRDRGRRRPRRSTPRPEKSTSWLSPSARAASASAPTAKPPASSSTGMPSCPQSIDHHGQPTDAGQHQHRRDADRDALDDAPGGALVQGGRFGTMSPGASRPPSPKPTKIT